MAKTNKYKSNLDLRKSNIAQQWKGLSTRQRELEMIHNPQKVSKAVDRLLDIGGSKNITQAKSILKTYNRLSGGYSDKSDIIKATNIQFADRKSDAQLRAELRKEKSKEKRLMKQLDKAIRNTETAMEMTDTKWREKDYKDNAQYGVANINILKKGSPETFAKALIQKEYKVNPDITDEEIDEIKRIAKDRFLTTIEIALDNNSKEVQSRIAQNVDAFFFGGKVTKKGNYHHGYFANADAEQVSDLKVAMAELQRKKGSDALYKLMNVSYSNDFLGIWSSDQDTETNDNRIERATQRAEQLTDLIYNELGYALDNSGKKISLQEYYGGNIDVKELKTFSDYL